MPMKREPLEHEPGWQAGGRAGEFRPAGAERGGEAARGRFVAIHTALERLMARPAGALHVADIGCGAGTQCRIWAERGHHAHGVDVNKALIALARKRAAEAALAIDYEVACATALPWPDLSMDLCLLPDLLQHVADWRACLAEAVRVLKPGGVLYISTSNMLCPVQHEFDLPFYSWYPGFLKRHYEDLATTTRPELAGYASHPAVNWFTWYGLRQHLGNRGLACMDRFDMADAAALGAGARLLVALVRAVPLARFCAHVATPYTVLLALKPLG
jgi:SAM-dependent methyltransferase